MNTKMVLKRINKDNSACKSFLKSETIKYFIKNYLEHQKKIPMFNTKMIQKFSSNCKIKSHSVYLQIGI